MKNGYFILGLIFSLSLLFSYNLHAASYDPVNYVVMDDAEDGVPSKGYRGNVSNVFDPLRNSRVTFVESGTAYLYKQAYWDPSDSNVDWQIPAKGISWAIRSNQDFEFKIKVETDNGIRYIVYYSSATGKSDSSPYLYFNMGTDLQDGNWHDIIKDIESDLDSKESGNHVKYVRYVAIKAQTNAAVDDIRAYPENSNGGVDITPPEIHILGSNIIDIEQSTPYVEQGAFAVDNVTPTESLTVTIDASAVNTNTPGMYRVKYDVADAAGNSAKTVYRVINVRSPETVIGPREVFPTPAELGTFFVSVNGSGSGNGSSINDAVSWSDFLNGKWKDVQAGDVVFFRGGTYYFTTDLPGWNLSEGKKNQPVIFESYPGEWAVFDGSKIDSLDIHAHNGNVTLYGNYIWLRKVEFNRLPHWGPRVWGAFCIIEGVKSHHNLLSGLEVSYDAIHATLRDNELYENSDLDIKPGGGPNGDLYDEYNLGNNADGATLHSGTMNILSHNFVSHNSDDGLDTWDANLTVFSYNYVERSGQVSYKGHGDGGGLKLGSGTNYGTQVFHNITYHIDFQYGSFVAALKNNASTAAVMSYNTMHLSKYTIDYVPSSRIYRNLALRATHGLMNTGSKDDDNNLLPPTDTVENSFNMIPAFLSPDYSTSIAEYSDSAEYWMLSLDADSPDFLKPKPDGLFANIGAYANDNALKDIVPPSVFPYGDTEVTIPKGALYIEHGAFAYDAKDGELKVNIIGHIDNTNVDGTYLIKYIASDKAGNTSSYTRTVTVGAGGPPTGINELSDDKDEISVAVYPNPASEIVHVNVSDAESNDLVIMLVDITGRVVSTYTAHISGNNFDASDNVSNLRNGIYVVHVIDGRKSYNKKMIISH